METFLQRKLKKTDILDEILVHYHFVYNYSSTDRT